MAGNRVSTGFAGLAETFPIDMFSVLLSQSARHPPAIPPFSYSLPLRLSPSISILDNVLVLYLWFQLQLPFSPQSPNRGLTRSLSRHAADPWLARTKKPGSPRPSVHAVEVQITITRERCKSRGGSVTLRPEGGLEGCRIRSRPGQTVRTISGRLVCSIHRSVAGQSNPILVSPPPLPAAGRM